MAFEQLMAEATAKRENKKEEKDKRKGEKADEKLRKGDKSSQSPDEKAKKAHA